MSFYNSLKQLSFKIEQKNVIFATGNVNELIDVEMTCYKNNFPLVEVDDENKNLINLIDHLCYQAKGLNYSTIKYFSANKGIVNFLDKSSKNNQSDSDFKELEDNISCLSDFIDQIKKEINAMEEEQDERYKKIFIIDSGDILLNRNTQEMTAIKLSSLIGSFTEFCNQAHSTYVKNKTKLVIIARNDDVINNLISRNNIEFASHTILKPNKEERQDFFDRYKSKFHCLNESTKNISHQDFRDAITYSDGLSFREMIQYAKIDNNVDEKLQNKLSFKELYKLINFNKQDSEWEKIDLEKMKNIDDILSKRVKGQELALSIVKATIIRSFTGMNGVLHSTTNNRKPKGSLFFVGPTGTGKTELAKAISEFVYGDETRIIRFDMSEFGQEHSDQRLIGAPPGYVGHDSGGELTNAVKQKPFSILLFDEIEKAHPKILDKFLQILEDGRLTSSQGEVIDFSETFIIFTSNIGTKDVNNVDIKNNKLVCKHFLDSVSLYFRNEIGRPELLNRIGYKNIVPFTFITNGDIIEKIITSKLNQLNKLLNKEKNIELEFINDAKKQIVEKVSSSYDQTMGGRGLISELETYFIDSLSEFIFNNFKIIKKNISQDSISKIKIKHSKELSFSIDE